MFYYVCFQNCYEYYFSEEGPSIKFDSFDAAIRYLTSLTEDSPFPTPKPDGDIRWYFANCWSDGVLHNPDADIDRLELYQIINIIPSNSDNVYIGENCENDPDAIISMRRYYVFDYLGNVSLVSLGKIEYLEHDD